MSRVRIDIDRLVLKGFDPADRKAIVEGLREELARLTGPARSQRTPVLRLGSMPWDPGPAGTRKLGGSIGRAVGKGLKP